MTLDADELQIVSLCSATVSVTVIWIQFCHCVDRTAYGTKGPRYEQSTRQYQQFLVRMIHTVWIETGKNNHVTDSTNLLYLLLFCQRCFRLIHCQRRLQSAATTPPQTGLRHCDDSTAALQVYSNYFRSSVNTAAQHTSSSSSFAVSRFLIYVSPTRYITAHHCGNLQGLHTSLEFKCDSDVQN